MFDFLGSNAGTAWPVQLAQILVFAWGLASFILGFFVWMIAFGLKGSKRINENPCDDTPKSTTVQYGMSPQDLYDLVVTAPYLVLSSVAGLGIGALFGALVFHLHAAGVLLTVLLHASLFVYAFKRRHWAKQWFDGIKPKDLGKTR